MSAIPENQAFCIDEDVICVNSGRHYPSIINGRMYKIVRPSAPWRHDHKQFVCRVIGYDSDVACHRFRRLTAEEVDALDECNDK